MSFTDYQRQIEIISDPAAVEQWKEEARKVTTFTTLREEPPVTFTSATEVERHFKEKHLPEMVRNVAEVTIEGVPSRRLLGSGPSSCDRRCVGARDALAVTDDAGIGRAFS